MRSRRFLTGLTVALGGPAIASAISEWIVPRLGEDFPGLAYMMAVLAATLAGGVLAGIVAALLSAVLVDFFHLAPERSVDLLRGDTVLLVAFLLATVATAWFVGRQRRGRRGAETERLRLGLALNATQMGMWRWDVKTNVVTWDERQESIYGLPAGRFGGTFEQYSQLVHPDDRDAVQAAIARAAESRSDLHVEHRAVRPNGSVRWIEGWGRAVLDDSGSLVGMVGVAADVTERHLAGEERVRLQEAEAAASARLGLLAEVGEALTSALDSQSTLELITRTAVVSLADYSIAYLRHPNGELREAACSHWQPTKTDTVRRMAKLASVAEDDPTSLVAKAMQTRRPVLLPTVSEEMIRRVAAGDEQLRLIRELGFRSCMIVPILRKQSLGALAFVRGSDAFVPFGGEDLQLAEELARRAGQGLENAHMHEERERIADTLQSSLLPAALPEIEGIELASRFRAAGRGSEVGGDFYDVFEGKDGSWAVAVGDVCGKGAGAAAVTGLARYTIRTLAMFEGRPSRVLSILNEALLRQTGDERFCTVCYARVRAQARGARVTVSSGGHPAPLVLRKDGSVEPVEVEGTLLGIFPDPELADRSLDLDPGDVIVFYTDGITEARGPDGFYGQRRLEALLAGAAGAGAEEIADLIERSLAGHGGDEPQRDDMAILVLRVAP